MTHEKAGSMLWCRTVYYSAGHLLMTELAEELSLSYKPLKRTGYPESSVTGSAKIHHAALLYRVNIWTLIFL